MKETLKKLGLTDYEIKVYITLMEYGSLTGREISIKSGVPQGRTYDILSKLEEIGLVSILPRKPKIFRAKKSEIGIKNLVTDKIEGLKELENEFLENLKTLKKKKLPSEKIEEKVSITSGKKEMWNYSRYFHSTAEKEVLGIFTYEIPLPFDIQREIALSTKKGVITNIITTTKINARIVEESKKLGCELKYYPVEGFRFLIKDRKEALIIIINPKDTRDRINIHIESPHLSKALAEYFYVLWKKAKTI